MRTIRVRPGRVPGLAIVSMLVVGVAAGVAGQPPATPAPVPGDLAARFAALKQPSGGSRPPAS